LWVRAPRTMMLSLDILKADPVSLEPAPSRPEGVRTLQASLYYKAGGELRRQSAGQQ